MPETLDIEFVNADPRCVVLVWTVNRYRSQSLATHAGWLIGSAY